MRSPEQCYVMFLLINPVMDPHQEEMRVISGMRVPLAWDEVRDSIKTLYNLAAFDLKMLKKCSKMSQNVPDSCLYKCPGVFNRLIPSLFEKAYYPPFQDSLPQNQS